MWLSWSAVDSGLDCTYHDAYRAPILLRPHRTLTPPPPLVRSCAERLVRPTSTFFLHHYFPIHTYGAISSKGQDGGCTSVSILRYAFLLEDALSHRPCDARLGKSVFIKSQFCVRRTLCVVELCCIYSLGALRQSLKVVMLEGSLRSLFIPECCYRIQH